MHFFANVHGVITASYSHSKNQYKPAIRQDDKDSALYVRRLGIKAETVQKKSNTAITILKDEREWYTSLIF